LYVTTPDAYISKDGSNIVVSTSGQERFRIPVSNIESIYTFGYQGASPGVMKLCADNGVALSFFSPHGRFIARLQGPVRGNIMLRSRQYEIVGAPLARQFAALFVSGKIYNSRVTLRRFIRDYPQRSGTNEVESTTRRLKHMCATIHNADDSDHIRGIEGEAAALYFKAFPHLILNNDFTFDTRTRRPPTDMVNAMLSLGYALLANDCASALEGVGLDPAAGFLHTMRAGRNSLALDIMEEMRSYIVDRLVLSLINNRQVSRSDFKLHSSTDNTTPTPVLFNEAGIKKFLSAWQAKKKTEITHPFLNEKIKIGLLPHIQALLLARAIRGDLDSYPVFFAK
ncbi:MAG: type I-C CRISPR-associated endonuclease Cas1c, partial [Candidatus Amulumruptor sp.]|nr:type I-C CRISPR-associated endonuclease Cas1c [Candidatus Amulumruptor sp.]